MELASFLRLTSSHSHDIINMGIPDCVVVDLYDTKTCCFLMMKHDEIKVFGHWDFFVFVASFSVQAINIVPDIYGNYSCLI